MAITPVGTGAVSAVAPEQISRSGASADMPFSQLVTDLLKDVNAQQVNAQQSIQDLATGQADSLQGVVLNVAKSDLTFRLLMEIRDRVISSYQEVMRMQV
jgi:flagellar hook-basal body complex protein FliE